MVLKPNDPIYNAGLKYVNGLNTLWSAAKKLLVTPGACRDSTNTNDLLLSESVLIDASKQGAAGLDVGVLAPDKFYQVFLIADSTKYKPTSAIVSLSFEPVLPTGYDMYRRIGVVRSDSVAAPNVSFYQYFQDGIGQSKKYIFSTSVLLNAAPLSSTPYAYLDVEVGAGSSAGVPAIPLSAMEGVFAVQFGAGSNVYFLPYDSSIIGTGIAGSVHYVPTVASTDTIELALGARVALVGQPAVSSIMYRGGFTSIWACGFVDQLD